MQVGARTTGLAVGHGNRPLVDFIVIGAMRAGTTLLHDVLSRHPQISMARMKETDFFIPEKNNARGNDWYIRQFQEDFPIRGEISPNYSKTRDFPGVAQRIAAACPDARLIYMLRDPVRRAVSQYEHSWNMGEIQETPEALAGGHEYFSILDASSYARQLDEYLRYFPASQILVIDFESFLAEPQRTLSAILDHIGATPMDAPPMTRQNGNDELQRVPKSVLRLTQGRLRPLLTTLLGPKLRGAARRLLARGPKRDSPAFPVALLQRVREDLEQDTARLRQMTGQEFAAWSS